MGGQQAYMDSYLDDRKGALFKDVGAFVYVFDMGNSVEQDDEDEWEGDFRYWRESLRLLHQHSPSAQVICLLHKMDLVDSSRRKEIYMDRTKQLRAKANELGVQSLRCCGTSIWDESLYRAWSQIIHSLIPNITALEKNLDEFVDITGATEAVIFEKTTFLVIARSGSSGGDSGGGGDNAAAAAAASLAAEGYPSTEAERRALLAAGKMHPDRFEKISELVKNLRGTCQKWTANSGGGGGGDDAGDDQGGNDGNDFAIIDDDHRQQQQGGDASKSSPSSSSSSPTAFSSFEVRGANFSAYLDWFTSNTYILVIVADPRVSLEAVKMNVQLGRERFEKLG